MKKVIILADSVNPFNDFLFNNLHSSDSFEVFVYYRINTPSLYKWNIEDNKKFKYKFYRSAFWIDFSVLKDIIINKNASYIQIGYNGLTNVFSILLLGLLKRKWIYWTDTPYPSYFSGFKGKLRFYFIKFIYNSVKVFFTTGISSIDFFVENGFNEYKLLNFPFFLDLNISYYYQSLGREIAMSKFHIKSEDYHFVFLMSGRLIKSKGFCNGIKYLEWLKKRSIKCKLLIAGLGPDKQYLEELAHSIGVQDDVSFVGWLNDQDLDAFYKAGDFFLHMPEFDPFPTVVIQAMIYSKPVIGYTSAGTINDRVIDYANGLKINGLYDEAFFTLLTNVMENKHIICEMGKEARITAEEWPVQRGIKIIQSVLS